MLGSQTPKFGVRFRFSNDSSHIEYTLSEVMVHAGHKDLTKSYFCVLSVSFFFRLVSRTSLNHTFTLKPTSASRLLRLVD
jgi:hypothetical protein